MNFSLNTLLSTIILVNFIALGSSRMKVLIYAVSFQGMILGITPIFREGHFSSHVLLTSLCLMLIKGVIIPAMLLRAMREASIRREVEPLVGFTASLILGAIGTGLCVNFAHSLPLLSPDSNTLIVPTAFATVFTGFLILFSRRKAITQVVGYLIFDNGIFIFGLLLFDAMPLIIEMGVLLDLLVGVLVMGIIVNHIQRTFSSLDTQKLTALREQ